MNTHCFQQFYVILCQHLGYKPTSALQTENYYILTTAELCEQTSVIFSNITVSLYWRCAKTNCQVAYKYG